MLNLTITCDVLNEQMIIDQRGVYMLDVEILTRYQFKRVWLGGLSFESHVADYWRITENPQSGRLIPNTT
jgi:hypothetical protein